MIFIFILKMKFVLLNLMSSSLLQNSSDATVLV